MTVHPESGVLLAYADDELSRDEHREVARHLAECAGCSAAVASLRAETMKVADAVYALDDAEPAHWSRDGTADVLPLRLHAVQHRADRYRSSDVLRWAAGILLVAGATASAAVVGTRLSERDDASARGVAPVTVPPGAAAVMVTPAGGEVRIVVSGAGTASRLFMSFADRATASVAVEGAASPRFRVVDGRVDLDLQGATAVVRLTLPQSLRAASVTTNGTTAVTVQDGQVMPAEAAAAGVALDGGAPVE